MDIVEKAKRIKALVEYTKFESAILPLNYALNSKIDSAKTEGFYVYLEDVYSNTYRAYVMHDPIILDADVPEKYDIKDILWEEIVSNIYSQFYHFACDKAKKEVLQRLTVAEVENFIKAYGSLDKRKNCFFDQK